MYIERIQVDEGFLDGLDIRLVRGLNVVIGPRGSGKTSLIELVRFCVGAPAFTEMAGRRGQQQVEAILQGGQVTLTLTDGVNRIKIVRSLSDDGPRATGEIPDITVLGQNEIEAVGAQARGRLLLIDRLRHDPQQTDRMVARATAELRSATTEIRDILLEIDDMELRLAESKTAPADLKKAAALEASALESARATEKDREQLASLQGFSAQLSVRRNVFERALAELEQLSAGLSRLTSRQVLGEEWPESAGDQDLLAEVRLTVSLQVATLGEVREKIDAAAARITGLLQADVESRVQVDDQARAIRQRLDAVEEGVGALTRQVEELKELVGQRTALQRRVQQKRKRAAEIIESRDRLYRELDAARQTRFNQRRDIAQGLSDNLRPSVEVEVVRSEQTEEYSDAIISALRGSGLHYNTLGPAIAGSMSPLELLKAVEARDHEPIALASEITDQRAANLVEHLKQTDLAGVVSASIEDGVTLRLLDGSVYKTSEEVSIGQRCTTVLPVLLSRHGGVLVVDQPEDQLDNSFVASTVVHALRQRGENDQFIFASHNANIPVLGEADLVIALDSDGKRGYKTHAGRLDDPSTVRTIIEVMEGGADAFRRRREFYDSGGQES